MNKGLSIVGSSRKNGEREMDDFYPSPPYVVEELLKREKFEGSIWECACGEGAISNLLIDNNYNVYSSDLIYRGYGDQLDFLKTNLNYDNIITNPPYKLGKEFILKAKESSNKKIAMFFKTVFLESESRYEMFQDSNYKLETVYQFSKRISLYKNGIKLKNSGMIAYAWFVWNKDYKGDTKLKWIL